MQNETEVHRADGEHNFLRCRSAQGRPNMASLAPDGWWHGAPFHSSYDVLCHQRSIDAHELVRVRRGRRPPFSDAII